MQIYHFKNNFWKIEYFKGKYPVKEFQTSRLGQGPLLWAVFCCNFQHRAWNESIWIANVFNIILLINFLIIIISKEIWMQWCCECSDVVILTTWEFPWRNLSHFMIFFISVIIIINIVLIIVVSIIIVTVIVFIISNSPSSSSVLLHEWNLLTVGNSDFQYSSQMSFFIYWISLNVYLSPFVLNLFAPRFLQMYEGSFPLQVKRGKCTDWNN